MNHTRRLYALTIALLLLASAMPSSMAATYVIEHDGELDRLAWARASRSALIDLIMTVDDGRDPYVYDDFLYDDFRHSRYDSVGRYGNDDYLECIDDAKDDRDDRDIDDDDYGDELRDCERRYRSDYRFDGPLRSLEWFYEWKFNPRTFMNRYCQPHLHRSPGTDGPTWYEITWTHDCTPHGSYHAHLTRPRYERASTIVHYDYENYAVDDPEVVIRPLYRQQDNTAQYAPSPDYPESMYRHETTRPELEKTYSAAAHRQLREYCERTRATDGSMNGWCQERKHLWS